MTTDDPTMRVVAVVEALSKSAAILPSAVRPRNHSIVLPPERPFVTNGTAVTPPAPELVATGTPAPSCLNHASTVNWLVFRPDAAPKVT